MIRAPFNIHDHGRRIVRRAVAQDTELADAIMHLAMGSRTRWTIQEIEALNTELDDCNLPLDEWLQNR